MAHELNPGVLSAANFYKIQKHEFISHIIEYAQNN